MSRSRLVDEYHRGADMDREPCRQDANFLQAIISSASDSEAQIFVLSSPSYQVVHTNAAWARLCGTSAEAVGQPCVLLQGASAEPGELRLLQAGLRDLRPARVRLASYDAARVPFVGELTLMPLTDQVGDVSHFVGILRKAGDEATREQATLSGSLHESAAATTVFTKPPGGVVPSATRSGENSPRLPSSPGLSTDTLLAKDSFPMHNLHNHPIAPVLLRMLQARSTYPPPARAFPRPSDCLLLRYAVAVALHLTLAAQRSNTAPSFLRSRVSRRRCTPKRVRWGAGQVALPIQVWMLKIRLEHIVRAFRQRPALAVLEVSI
jgi:hypothetical protein